MFNWLQPSSAYHVSLICIVITEKKQETPVKKCVLCLLFLFSCTLHTYHRWRKQEEVKVPPYNIASGWQFFFLSSVMNSWPKLGAMARIRSCLFGPSVNYSGVNHACRIQFPLCCLLARLSDDQTAPMSFRTPDTPSVCLYMWCTFEMLHRVLLK